MAQQINFNETIGILSSAALDSTLELLLEPHPYLIKSFQKVDELREWVESLHPRLVILDSRDLEQELKPTPNESMLQLRRCLEDLRVISLVISRAASDWGLWRQQDWPHLHFYHGVLKGHKFLGQLLDLLKERHLLDSPEVLYWGDEEDPVNELRVLLREEGFRLRFMSQARHKSPEQLIREGSVDATVLSASAWSKWEAQDREEWLRGLTQQKRLWYLWDVHEDASQTDEKKWPTMLYGRDGVGELVEQISSEIVSRSPSRKVIRAQETSGIYEWEAFKGLVSHELQFASQHGERFTVLTASLKGMDGFRHQFGRAIADELCQHFGLFVKNRIRSTDIPTLGRGHSVHVLLSRVPKDMAENVGHRLTTGFKSLIAFYAQTHPDMVPTVSYKLTSFPDDFKGWESLEKIINNS